MVYDLENMTELIELNRGDYHVNVSPYPFEFFEHNDKTLMVTARDWDMIDVIDPYTKQVLTKRDWEEISEQKREDGPASAHTEFKSSVYISPDNKWIVEDGWVWHPVGVIVRWDFKHWIEKNKWEADLGNSIKTIRTAEYSWGNPIEWLDNDRLLVWGFGDDDDYMLPAVMIYDINTCKEINWFFGPDNSITYDGYLFSWNQKSMWAKHSIDSDSYYKETRENGTGIFCVWDIETGELIQKDNSIKPVAYNRKTKKFITIAGRGKFKLSKLNRRY